MAIHGSLDCSLDKIVEQASASGQLSLPTRNLKVLPSVCSSTNLKDTIFADLSRNKLNEVPNECCNYHSLETFLLYHNNIKSIPDSIVALQSLQYLDLSRNSLAYLPSSLCELPLQGLIVNNNKLVSLPEDVSKMSTLLELDVSANQIAHLPVQIGDLTSLKSLNLRRNHLQEIPVEISYLQLVHLDLSGNRICNLPVELRFMNTLVTLHLSENPLLCPPANLASRGRVHIFKYLEIQAIKEDRKRGVLTESEYRRTYRKTPGSLMTPLNGFGVDSRHKRHTADSGYGSEQPNDGRWSQEIMDKHTEDARRIVLRAASSQASRSGPVHLYSTASNGSASSSGYSSYNGYEINSAPIGSGTLLRLPPQSSSSPSSVSSLSPSESSKVNGLEEEFSKMIDGMFVSTNGEDALDGPRNTTRHKEPYKISTGHTIPSSVCSLSKLPRHNQPLPAPSKALYNSFKGPPLKVSSLGTSLETPGKIQTYRQYKEQLKQQRQLETLRTDDKISEMKNRLYLATQTASGKKCSFSSPSTLDVKTLQKEAVLSYVKFKSSEIKNNGGASLSSSSSSTSSSSSSSSIPMLTLKSKTSKIPPNPPERSFTARRDAEKSATSEAHISQLRMHIESRLRLSLPEDIAASLVDGVILCHMANHVRPRSVPSIHVPSPAVPKLTTAKCRRNVENFLLACRKIGVREDLICSPADILEPRKQGTVRLSISISELLRFHVQKQPV